MNDKTTIIRDRLLAIRREMDRRGIPLKQVSFDSGIDYGTLLTYLPAEGSRDPASIPMSAVFKLIEGKALPQDLLSLMLPTGWALVQVPESVDHNKLASLFLDYLNDKQAAHHPDSENGPEIGPNENEKLCAKVTQLKAGVA